ncbi:MAG: alpha/beta fold hydrolase, partial [Alphaproteobacteria bacterium]
MTVGQVRCRNFLKVFSKVKVAGWPSRNEGEKMFRGIHFAIFTVWALIATAMSPAAPRAAQPVSAGAGVEVVATAADGVRVHGQAWFAGLGDDAPLILLFHQARSNGRGEYGPLVGWLNAAGFRVVAWDQRSGGGHYGSRNRTVADLGGRATDYCAAWPDLEAALDYARRTWHPHRLAVWGSSYSGALVFRLAAEHGDAINALVAFSPAFGNWTRACVPDRPWTRLRMPAHAFWPESEYAYASVRRLGEEMRAAGVAVTVVPNGIHGSSMLVDERTGHDMSAARATVVSWLK